MKRISIFTEHIKPLVPGVFRGEDKLTILSLINAIMKHMVTSVNGIEPDENGNVQIQAGGGATVKVGTTSTLEPGNDATVTNIGSDTNVVLNFGIPKGDTGKQGPAGANGNAATIRVGNVTTLPAGSNATVVNSGDENNAVFDFGIPQGQPGSGGGGGSTVSVNVGTTSTLEPGENATVTNSGTEENVVLNFGIPKGEKGEPGVNGKDGAQGIPGNDGKAATVTVGSVSTLPAGSQATVVNSGTDTAAVLDFGIPQGQPGSGGGGSAVTVNVGTTTTLEPGADATVTNSGTEENVVLNFGIPKGEKGERGEPGANGQDGAPGTDGKDGAAATIAVGSVTTLAAGQSATVTNSGNKTDAVLNFGIPRGATGQPGSDGKAATVTVGTVSTLPAGSNATVTNVGTATDAIFNFGIPKGEDGGGGGINIVVGQSETFNFANGARYNKIVSGLPSRATVLAALFAPYGTVSGVDGNISFIISEIPGGSYNFLAKNTTGVDIKNAIVRYVAFSNN